MTAAGRRRALVGAAVAVQATLVPIAVYPSLSARVTGSDYLLAVAPVDPIDPFRGAYVTLRYPGVSNPVGSDGPDGSVSEEEGTVYVPLVRDGTRWRGGPASTQPPAAGPFLRCQSDGWSRRCGIESLFLPQDEAAQLEGELGEGGALARVRVDGRGNATVLAVEPAADAEPGG